MLYDKFVVEYIDFINKYFDDHIFIVVNSEFSKNKYSEPQRSDNVYFFQSVDDSLDKIHQFCSDSDNIILHSFFERKFVYYLDNNPQILKKSTWIIWGGDLYYYKFREFTETENLYEAVRTRVVRGLKSIVALVKEDYKIAKQVYQTKAKYYYAFYSNPLSYELMDETKSDNPHPPYISILAGNSATTSNNHIELFNILSKFKDYPIRIICPLSYGDMEYGKKAAEKGKEIFADKFYPIFEYMPPAEYAKLIHSIDIGIMNQYRQQAIGNMNALMYAGKKVFLRRDTSSFRFFKSAGAKVFATDDISEQSFEEFLFIDEVDLLLNSAIMRSNFREKTSVRLWNSVFIDLEARND